LGAVSSIFTKVLQLLCYKCQPRKCLGGVKFLAKFNYIYLEKWRKNSSKNHKILFLFFFPSKKQLPFIIFWKNKIKFGKLRKKFRHKNKNKKKHWQLQQPESARNSRTKTCVPPPPLSAFTAETRVNSCTTRRLHVAVDCLIHGVAVRPISRDGHLLCRFYYSVINVSRQ
jgi:hypothetical protein